MTVRLRNGAEEATPLMAIVMGILEHLAEGQPLVLYDLVMKCRDRDYQFHGDTEKYLRELKLIDVTEGIHDSDKNIILSAVRGDDGFDIVLGSPLAKEAK